MKLPQKIYPMEYAGFWDLQVGPYYIDESVLNEQDTSNAEQIVTEIVKCYNEKQSRKKIVCYCGSLHVAKDAFQKADYISMENGEIALMPCCMHVDIQREYGATSDYKIKADELHKRKIDICDEVRVLNVGGYIGESTRSEIEYAESIGKPIIYLEKIS